MSAHTCLGKRAALWTNYLLFRNCVRSRLNPAGPRLKRTSYRIQETIVIRIEGFRSGLTDQVANSLADD